MRARYSNKVGRGVKTHSAWDILPSYVRRVAPDRRNPPIGGAPSPVPGPLPCGRPPDAGPGPRPRLPGLRAGVLPWRPRGGPNPVGRARIRDVTGRRADRPGIVRSVAL